MEFHLWLLVLGAVLLGAALVHPVMQRLPLTTTILYLLIGVALGPMGIGALQVFPLKHAAWLHHGSEVAVIISLFTVGMKLRLPVTDPSLRPAFGLAFLSMTITVAMVAGVAVWSLALPLGAAILLGAVLAPTDPVLASDVQMRHAKDRDRVRMTLTVESGMNDGTAFPFVYLGLGLLGLREIGEAGGRWLAVDVVWAVCGGLGIGWLLGQGIGRFLLRAHRRKGEPVSYGEYLVLGLIGVTYGIAVQVETYGFLAVFAAGVALRAVERQASAATGRADTIGDDGDLSVSHHDPRAAPAHLATTLLTTNEQLEHLLEVAMVLIVGASLSQIGFSWEAGWLAVVLFFAIRPLACAPVLWSARFSRAESLAVSWFGIRGIGSVYYVMYAVEHGLPEPLAERLISITFGIIALSVFVHGISVTPLLEAYRRRRRAR